MFELRIKHWSWNQELQIIVADVTLKMDHEMIVDEPLCVDVGMPALVRSVQQDSELNRFATPGEWWLMPFFVCGCGDPACRGFSFIIKHLEEDQIRITHVEEKTDGNFREYESCEVSLDVYRQCVLEAAHAFNAYVSSLGDAYQPLLANTAAIVRELIEQAEDIS
ncbi:hypothetical protein [Paenibacillus sp. KN14-4R]|uniref:hypothetical protein n=1 Tax=Paenibacillus sp. KN14-4R TaxID=3445773 RepID=UPI003F9EE241